MDKENTKRDNYVYVYRLFASAVYVKQRNRMKILATYTTFAMLIPKDPPEIQTDAYTLVNFYVC